MGMNVNLRQLEVFACVAEFRSFTDAARSLRLTQSALSRTVQQLEAALGCRLFDRSTRAVVLTPEGTEFLGVARRATEELNGGLRYFEQFVAGRRGRVSIATIPSVAVSVLAPVVARFQRQQPEVDLFILDGISGGVLGTVLQGKADCGLAFSTGLDAEVVFEPLLSDRFFALCPKEHPLARKKTVRWKDLAKYPFLGSAPTSSVRHFTDAAFLQAGVEVRNLYQPTGVPPLVSLVAQGLGVTALPGLVLPIAEFAGLVHRPLVEPALIRQIGVLTRSGLPQSPAARAFLAFLRQEIRSDRVGGKYQRPTG